MEESIAILILALAIDLLLGEPPNAIHPVAWMGKFTSLWEKEGLGKKPVFQLSYGTVMTLITIMLFTVSVFVILREVRAISSIWYIVVGGILFKTTFSLRGLGRVATAEKRLLLQGKLDEARHELRSLCKRDAQNLPEPLIVSATVESVAENASDSFVAPLFYFLLFGIPGAMAYRVINTLDAMIGRRGKYEYLGKAGAKLDTVANLIPARLTALLLVLAAWITKHDWRSAWRTLLSDHARTESPNAGWPMAAMAGALNVTLEKVGHYILGGGNKQLAPGMIDSSVKLVYLCGFIWVVVCVAMEAGIHAITS